MAHLPMRIGLLLDERSDTAPRLEQLFSAAGHDAVVNPDWSELEGFDVGMIRADSWEPGLSSFFFKALLMESRGASLFNSIRTMLRGDDKAIAGRLMAEAGLDVPATWLLAPGQQIPRRDHGWVIKPRVGTEQVGVEVFTNRADAQSYLDSCSTPQIVQERIYGPHWRVIATPERAVRTYTMPVDERGVTLLPDGVRRTVIDDPDPRLEAAGVEAVRAIGGTMLGVDLLEDSTGRYWAIEVNPGFGFNVGDDPVEEAMVAEATRIGRDVGERYEGADRAGYRAA